MFNIQNTSFARKSWPWNSGTAIAYRSTCSDATWQSSFLQTYRSCPPGTAPEPSQHKLHHSKAALSVPDFQPLFISTGQCAKKLPYAENNSKKPEIYKLCGTQTSRWCKGYILMTEMMKMNGRMAGLFSLLHNLGIGEEGQRSRKPQR